MILFLVAFGSVMIMSAEMGEFAGQIGVIAKTARRQLMFIAFGIFLMIFLSKINLMAFRIEIYWIFYFLFLILLLVTRISGSTNGAYAWIRLGPISVQPSEFAKVFIMVFGTKLLSKNEGKNNLLNFKKFTGAAFVYFVIILLYQKDLGSAVVLAGICFIIAMLPPYKELNNIHFYMIISIILILILVAIMMSPVVNNFLMNHSSNYMIGRFLAAANPFAFQYDTGYHLIMGLVSFATGGLFGLGYGQSIHKYMNFPNPSNDFILPVIVEEMGVVFGLLPILLCYGIIFYRLIKHSMETPYLSCKMILSGTFAYLAIHFVLNVGGVSGLVPLTGVPLLLISSGGSSLAAAMAAIGVCESEIIRYRKAMDQK